MTESGCLDLESAARQIVVDQLSMPVLAIEPIVGLGKMNAVFRVDCGQDVFVVRLRPTEELEDEDYAKEAWCLERAAAVGIPVPTAHVYGDMGSYSYIVEDFIPGLPGSSEGIDVLRVWERLGEYAAKINGIAVVGYGGRMNISNPGEFLDTWDEGVAETLHKAFRDSYWVDAGLFPPEHIEVLKGLLERRRFVSAPAGLVHIDIGEWNTILRDGDVENLYLIDWDLSVAGPVPHDQVAWAWINAPYEDAYHAFTRGYGLTQLDLESMHEDVTALIALVYLHGLRLVQDNCPDDVPEKSKNTRSIVYDLYGDRLR